MADTDYKRPLVPNTTIYSRGTAGLACVFCINNYAPA